ncbi:MAG: SGNH/GDSL hydrolase family protein [Sulfitobacter sp.]
MRLFFARLGLILLCSLTGASAAQAGGERILVLGDSFMTSNGSAKQSFSHALSGLLATRVTNRAVTGARMIYNLPLTGALGMNISKQYRPGKWDYVVMNGGGNDLWLGCGCGRCANKLQRLISPGGDRGAIPQLVSQAQRDGARVIYVGYLRSPGRGSPIESCRDIGDALEARIAKMAQQNPNVSFVSLADMVPYGDRSFHASDMIHPSPKGSAAAAHRVAQVIKAGD